MIKYAFELSNSRKTGMHHFLALRTKIIFNYIMLHNTD